MKAKRWLLLLMFLGVCSCAVCLCACEKDHVHELVHFESREATCENAGNLEYWECSVCVSRFIDAEAEHRIGDVFLPALGHCWGEWQVLKEPTCEAEGNRCRSCLVCGKAEGESIAVSQHVLLHISAEEPTCYQTGVREHWECKGCGKLFSDGAGKSEVFSEDILLPFSHADSGVLEKDAEYHWKVCSKCGQPFDRQEHKFSLRRCSDCKTADPEQCLEYRLINGGTEYEVIGSYPAGESIIIPSTHQGLPVTSIGENVFIYKPFEEIILPPSIANIESGAFFRNNNLKSCVIPAATRSIGVMAFGECSSLESLVVEDGNPVYRSAGNCIIERAGGKLIEGTNASEIPVDGSIKIIGEEAFVGRDKLEEIVIPASVETIEESAFVLCSNLKRVVLSEGIRKIGSYSFQNCDQLAEIYIPSTLTEFGENTFSYCGNLEIIEVQEGNPIFHSENNCLIETQTKILIKGGKNSSIPDDGSVQIIASGAFENCEALASIDIPEGITTIQSRAFQNCTGLKSIFIPANVGYISDAFSGCSGLESIQVHPDNERYRGIGNCLIETRSKTLLLGCKNSVIPGDGSVEIIGEVAFYKCGGLTDIVIPEGIKEIQWSAFGDCSDLKFVRLPDSLETLAGNAFACCGRLEHIALPEGLSSIGTFCFYRCTALKSVVIPESVTRVGLYAFDLCSTLTDVYYGGSEEDWKNIELEASSWDESILQAQIHYNWTGDPE